jgi:site-specific recombinase XerD
LARSKLKAFMKWYAQLMDVFRINVPRALPQYVEDAKMNRLIRAIEDKRSHKESITRDGLVVESYLKTGMRRRAVQQLLGHVSS